MIQDAILQKSIYDWVKRTFSEQVIWAKQGENRPPKPYVVLNLIAGPVKKGLDDRWVGSDGMTEYSGPREMTLSVNYLGAEAMKNLSKLQTSMEFESSMEFLVARGITAQRESGIRDLSSAIENRFESRCQMDITLQVASVMKDPDSTIIEEVEVESDLDDSVMEIVTPEEG